MQSHIRRLLYAGVVFWSALLLFLVQPVITKAILPWFGGSAGVWTSSMLFFQLALLLGYLYAFVVNQKLTIRQQVLLHCSLLAISVFLLPIHPSPDWKPKPQSDPVLQILGLLSTSVGLPYFMLATTSPLLQAWFVRVFHAELPWWLYAVSNTGSLVALLAYPVLIEPPMSVERQLLSWSTGYGLFAVSCAAIGLLTNGSSARVEPVAFPPWSRVSIWLALSTVPSVMWLAVANQLTQDVAAVPFLWILPLSLYLLSFVLTFESQRWYRPRLFQWLLPAACAGFIAVAAQQGYLHFELTLLIYAISLLTCAVFCHGELARLKPSPEELTAFYVTIATGGALGGIFVGLIAPRIFDAYLELPISLIACVLLALMLLYHLPQKRILRIGGVAALGIVAALFTRSGGYAYQVNLRNFYGTLQVSESTEHGHLYRSLFNGSIQHGVQFRSADRSRIPTTYYGPASGAAIALGVLENRGPLRAGLIGLGAGTMAVWARPGDYYRFYEINPDVIRIAKSEFRFLRECKGQVDIVEGDARLSLEREPPQNFDLLVVDAFSGDSIPVHLLTREAFELYFRHIAPWGAIAVHITNKHLDIGPVVKLAARDQHAEAMMIYNSKEEARKIYYASWVIVTRDKTLQEKLGWLSSPIPTRRTVHLWTDDYSNLFSILK